MSVNEVVEQFRPIFRAELPGRMSAIHAALHAQPAEALEEAFRHAHNLAGTAAAMEETQLAVTAERLSISIKNLLTQPVTPATSEEAWLAYDALRAAANLYLGASSAVVVPAAPHTDRS